MCLIWSWPSHEAHNANRIRRSPVDYWCNRCRGARIHLSIGFRSAPADCRLLIRILHMQEGHTSDWFVSLQVNSALHPSGVAISSTSCGWGKDGKVSAAGWQVTLCDPSWRVISRSGVLISITNYCILTFNFFFFLPEDRHNRTSCLVIDQFALVDIHDGIVTILALLDPYLFPPHSLTSEIRISGGNNLTIGCRIPTNRNSWHNNGDGDMDWWGWGLVVTKKHSSVTGRVSSHNKRTAKSHLVAITGHPAKSSLQLEYAIARCEIFLRQAK